MYSVQTSESKQIHQRHVYQLIRRPANDEISYIPTKATEQEEIVFRKSTNTDYRWGSKNVYVPGRLEQRLSESPFKGFPEALCDSVSVSTCDEAASMEDLRAAPDSSPPPLAVPGAVSVTDVAAALDMKVLTDNVATTQLGSTTSGRRSTRGPPQERDIRYNTITFTNVTTEPNKFADYVP
ncbi:hypothetical protein PR048_029196 [Dryococelus australis]|uniref:Uncharacterized protein n=1 Tax=Dryococelus australis TaxID=614101 RepID=A0ABQ9GDA9_9NEOP|nr:hypothetical protein PR048_029196 [Dryococelus australis]